MNIMRADACRYMALYEYGGIYSDLDVTLIRPFHRHCNGLCVGKEYSNLDVFANYCIVSQRADTCLRRAIDLCCARLETVEMNFKADPHLVHNTCGPSAFTEAVQGCVESVLPNKIFARHVHHAIASAHWKMGYPSWVEERKTRAGWKHIYEH